MIFRILFINIEMFRIATNNSTKHHSVFLRPLKKRFVIRNRYNNEETIEIFLICGDGIQVIKSRCSSCLDTDI